jgi:hypothetical protein
MHTLWPVAGEKSLQQFNLSTSYGVLGFDSTILPFEKL